MVSYVCLICGYIYDPDIGDPKAGIQPGVEFDALPDDRVCPECEGGERSVRGSAGMNRGLLVFDHLFRPGAGTRTVMK
jgi:rubredoxin